MTLTSHQITAAAHRIAQHIKAFALTSSALKTILTEQTGRSDASGGWSWRDAYDLMEAASIQVELAKAKPNGTPEVVLSGLCARLQKLPTQTRRSENQIRMQQFSTPLPLAFIATCAADMNVGDQILDPSAGNGALACFAPFKCFCMRS